MKPKKEVDMINSPKNIPPKKSERKKKNDIIEKEVRNYDKWKTNERIWSRC